MVNSLLYSGDDDVVACQSASDLGRCALGLRMGEYECGYRYMICRHAMKAYIKEGGWDGNHEECCV